MLYSTITLALAALSVAPSVLASPLILTPAQIASLATTTGQRNNLREDILESLLARSPSPEPEPIVTTPGLIPLRDPAPPKAGNLHSLVSRIAQSTLDPSLALPGTVDHAVTITLPDGRKIFPAIGKRTSTIDPSLLPGSTVDHAVTITLPDGRKFSPAIGKRVSSSLRKTTTPDPSPAAQPVDTNTVVLSGNTGKKAKTARAVQPGETIAHKLGNEIQTNPDIFQQLNRRVLSSFLGHGPIVNPGRLNSARGLSRGGSGSLSGAAHSGGHAGGRQSRTRELLVELVARGLFEELEAREPARGGPGGFGGFGGAGGFGGRVAAV